MKRVLTIDEEIFLNQFSQGIHSLDEMNHWFETHDLQNKRDIMENLFNMVVQSHPRYDDIQESIIYLKKEKTSSAVMLTNRNKPFEKFGYLICNLPEKELQNGFDILLLTLSKADGRRRKYENADECSHWWHKDLSDEKYLDTIRQKQ